jgi:nitroimidazol reductase NimA-like FMN-containing flavoprotein (pyridoxamine 5'-phosphate oxidase superfamily)
MTGMRRKDKEITDSNEVRSILRKTKYVTIAMCLNDEPYLATLSHGYDEPNNCIYFHCAAEGKKISILQANNRVWGQAPIDRGYVQGSCDQLYATAQFSGKVTFVEEVAEKEHALKVMIRALDDNPEQLIKKQLLPESVRKVRIGRIDIDFPIGKKAEKVTISQRIKITKRVKSP